MKNILLIAATITLVGCAQLQPTEGMSLAQLNSMSARSGNNYLVLVKKIGDYEIYQSGSIVSSKQLIAQGNLISKAMFDPKKDVYYIVKNGALVKTADSEYELDKFVNNSQEMQRLGFTSQTDYEYGKSIGANASQVKQLQKYNINNYLDYQKAKQDFESNKSLYGNQDTPNMIVQFVIDKNTAKAQGKSIAQVVQARQAEQARLLKQRQEDEARRLAERAREFPFEATFTCGMGGSHINIMACFVGGKYAAKTQLEIRNGQEYGMYQGWELNKVGSETRNGFVIPLRSNFSIVAQNSDDTLILNLVVKNTQTGNILFTKSASKYGVISVKN